MSRVAGTTDKLLVDVRGACEALSIGRTTLHELVREGRIEVVRIGRAVRFPVRSLEAFISEQASANSRR